MPDAWTDKDERMYEHVRESEMAQGRSEEDAKRIAAARVNERRRHEGRPGVGKITTSDSGNPNKPLDAWTKQQLLNRARRFDITGRSKMTKAELVDAIRSRE